MLPLDNRSVLIVEDEPFIAFDLADAITDAGATIVGPALTVREADLIGKLAELKN